MININQENTTQSSALPKQHFLTFADAAGLLGSGNHNRISQLVRDGHLQAFKIPGVEKTPCAQVGSVCSCTSPASTCLLKQNNLTTVSRFNFESIDRYVSLVDATELLGFNNYQSVIHLAGLASSRYMTSPTPPGNAFS